MDKILHILLLINGSLLVSSTVQIREHWFSKYGKADYGRQLNTGVNIGKMSLLQCSVKCSTDDKCQALELDGSGGRIGPCYKFTKLTHNGDMIAAPGHKYIEKRKCKNVFHIDAVVVFPDVSRMFIYTGNQVFLYDLIAEEGNTILKYVFGGDINLTFPGIATLPVQAAFLGVEPESVYILAGGQLHYFIPSTQGSLFFFTQSAPNDVLTPFLTTHTGSVTAIVSVDLERTLLHIMDGDTFYRLRWNATTSKYDYIDSFSRADPGNMWSGIPDNINALSRSSDNTNYVVIEEYKIYWYHTGGKMIDGITNFCDYTS